MTTQSPLSMWTWLAIAAALGVFAILVPVEQRWGTSPPGYYQKPSFEECVQNNPGWEEDICEAISSSNLKTGMTKEQVKTSWGEPTRTNVTVTESGRREQWIYDRPHGNKYYLYFREDKLTGWQR